MSGGYVRRDLPAMLCVAVLGIAGAALAEDLSREYHETFDVEEGAKLVLRHGDGDVEITPWSTDQLDVQVRYRAKATHVGWSKGSEFKVEFRRDGDAIYVIGHEPKRVSIGISTYREYEYVYEIKAPDYLRLELEGEDGDVEISDWRGSIRMELEDGDVELRNIDSVLTEVALEDGDLEIDRIRGELLIECEDGDIELFDCHSERGRVRAEDGDITIDRCTGNFEITIADGDARLSKLTADDSDIRSSDGTVELALLPSDNLDLNIRVGDGDVVMNLDPAVSARFEFETDDGDIRVHAADVTDLEQSRRRVTGRIGAGAGSIYVRTNDGSVVLRR